jgi:hypothetical protein
MSEENLTPRVKEWIRLRRLVDMGGASSSEIQEAIEQLSGDYDYFTTLTVEEQQSLVPYLKKGGEFSKIEIFSIMKPPIIVIQALSTTPLPSEKTGENGGGKIA